MAIILGVVIIALAIYATARRLDVRLVLTLAALALATVAGLPALFQSSEDPGEALRTFAAGPMQIVRTFLTTLVAEKFVVPICCAMGFAHVLRLTECDKHLIQLLIRPLHAVRPLLVPGAVVVGFLVNIPVISQTSTAVCLGAVLIPLLRAAGISGVTAAAAILLGASIGGELLNPGAPEINTIASFTPSRSETEVVAHILPLDLLHLTLTTLLFWIGSSRYESKLRASSLHVEEAATVEAGFRLNYVKALIPLAPVVLLFLVGRPLEVFSIPREWLVAGEHDAAYFSSRLVGAAMVLGAVLAVLSTPSVVPKAAQAFFEGAGYAFSTIIAVIVAATCFGKGVELIGLADVLSRAIGSEPTTLITGAGAMTLSFAFLSGSGMAATQSLFRFFVAPANEIGLSLPDLGAVVSIGAAAGRTMSPVATVTLMCAAMTSSDPIAVVRRVAVPLLVSMAVVIVAAVWIAGH